MLPFIILVVLNWKVYHSIRTSDRRYPNLMFKQPLVLFAICFLFLLTHALRIILALYRLVYHDQFAHALENLCNPHQFWTLVAASVSRFLLIFNSSVNFVIYYFISKDFRVWLLIARDFCAPLTYSFVRFWRSLDFCAPAIVSMLWQFWYSTKFTAVALILSFTVR